MSVCVRVYMCVCGLAERTGACSLGPAGWVHTGAMAPPLERGEKAGSWLSRGTGKGLWSNKAGPSQPCLPQSNEMYPEASFQSGHIKVFVY